MPLAEPVTLPLCTLLILVVSILTNTKQATISSSHSMIWKKSLSHWASSTTNCATFWCNWALKHLQLELLNLKNMFSLWRSKPLIGSLDWIAVKEYTHTHRGRVSVSIYSTSFIQCGTQYSVAKWWLIITSPLTLPSVPGDERPELPADSEPLLPFLPQCLLSL